MFGIVSYGPIVFCVTRILASNVDLVLLYMSPREKTFPVHAARSTTLDSRKRKVQVA